jgi:hypothetical protein
VAALLASLLALLLGLSPGVLAADVAIPATEAKHSLPEQQINCQAVLAQLTGESNWLDHLLDPVITSQEGLLERLALYVEAHECLSNTREPLSSEMEAARTYLEYFLIFTIGYDTPEDSSYLRLVELATSDDPAVIQLRQAAGLAPPPGYIFIRFYRSRQAMPSRLRGLFAEDTAGLTLLTRYIAILEEDTFTWEQQRLQAQTLPRTVSHELVHAYVNASIGIEALEELPRWYAEGVAIYLSGSGEDHVVVGPDSTMVTTSPQDYRAYRDNFKFLEAKLGQERLLQVIRISVEQADPSIVYLDLGYSQDASFLAEARAYWQRRLILASGGILFLALLLIGWLLRLMPEVRCRYCRYAGKKSEFEGGYCPRCYQPYHR